jgi:hypothetical protein
MSYTPTREEHEDALEILAELYTVYAEGDDQEYELCDQYSWMNPIEKIGE